MRFAEEHCFGCALALLMNVVRGNGWKSQNDDILEHVSAIFYDVVLTYWKH